MSITIIGRPFNTYMENQTYKRKMIVASCDYCSTVFCLAFDKRNKNKSCGCQNAKESILWGDGTRTSVKCLQCSKTFDKKTSEVRDNPSKNFCSRSCSAKYHNARRPCRQKGNCIICKKQIASTLLYCSECSPTKCTDNDTIEQVLYRQHHKSSAFAKIRSRARAIGKKMGFSGCCLCDFDLHFEVAHIKAITDFPLDTKLSVVNDISNLAPLCPNCHWQFDKKLITEAEIRQNL